jgi:ABC-type transport system substrate-binding protein
MTRPARAGRLLAALVAAALIPACAGGGGVTATQPPTTAPTTAVPTTASPTTSQPVTLYGGDAVIGLAGRGSPRTLNPLLDGPDAALLDLIAPAVFATGWGVDPVTGDPMADVLEAVPTIDNGLVVDNGDGTIDVTVRVVDGARWSDGTPITGADLEFTHRVATDPELPIRRDVRARFERITPGSIEVSGRQVSFRMEASPDVELLWSIIVPRHQVEGTDFAADWNDRMWAAGGPFEFSQWEPGQFLELTRNPAYWKVTQAEGASLPFLDRVVFRFFEEADASVIDTRVVEAFQSGTLDVVWFAGSGDQFAAEGAEVASTPGSAFEFLAFQFGPGNRNEDSLNRYTAYRRAVATAIDLDVLAAERGTEAIRSVMTLFAPDTTGGAWDRYAFDPEAIPGLLYDVEQASGFDTFESSGPPLVLTVDGSDPAMVATGGLIVESLRENGFSAELQLEAPEAFFGETFDDGTWDVALLRLAGSPGTSDAVGFAELYDPDGLPFVGTNYFRWGTVDSTVLGTAPNRYRNILAQLRVTAAPADRLALLEEAEQVLAGQAVLIPLIRSGHVGLAVWPEAVIGTELNGAAGPVWNVDVWRSGG